MAIKNIIAKGIGFSPATLKWIPTHGFSIGSVAIGVAFHVEAFESFVPGSAESEVFVPGTQQREVFLPGSVDQEAKP